MKTFEDLKFGAHRGNPEAYQALAVLAEEIKISVVYGDGPRMGSTDKIGHGLYNDKGTYEVAVFDRGDMATLSTGDDVLGWQTPKEVTKLMKQIQKDPEKFREKCEKRRVERDAHWNDLVQ